MKSIGTHPELLNEEWPTIDGSKIKVKDMTESHARHALGLCLQREREGEYVKLQTLRDKIVNALIAEKLVCTDDNGNHHWWPDRLHQIPYILIKHLKINGRTNNNADTTK